VLYDKDFVVVLDNPYPNIVRKMILTFFANISLEFSKEFFVGNQSLLVWFFKTFSHTQKHH